jgi:hypothetical protein
MAKATAIQDENMQALFDQLRQQLATAKYPHDWWQNRHQAIAMLQLNAPRLFADLVQLYRGLREKQNRQ